MSQQRMEFLLTPSNSSSPSSSMTQECIANGFVCSDLGQFFMSIDLLHREVRNQHLARAFWLTGFSGAGKSSIAHGAAAQLFAQGKQVFVFDGDNLRHGLCADLDFSPEARMENIRRAAEAVKLFIENGTICICAFISPTPECRKLASSIIGEKYFYEIFIDCPVGICEERDVKGFYKRAREGEIKNYTGVSAPYVPPENPDLCIKTDENPLEISQDILYDFVLNNTKLLK